MVDQLFSFEYLEIPNQNKGLQRLLNNLISFNYNSDNGRFSAHKFLLICTLHEFKIQFQGNVGWVFDFFSAKKGIYLFVLNKRKRFHEHDIYCSQSYLELCQLDLRDGNLPQGGWLGLGCLSLSKTKSISHEKLQRLKIDNNFLILTAGVRTAVQNCFCFNLNERRFRFFSYIS